jgi:UDP-glucose:(heptosyl)LPS alpha-1,3-glucosyltransferase
MIHHFGVDPTRINVVYNGVDTERYRPAEKADLRTRREGLRRSWGLEDRVVFLLVAHNLRLKGLDALLGAIVRLKRPDIGLVVAGNDRATPYQRAAARLGIADQVRFVGNHSDAAPLFQAADVYVQPTFYDPCSLVVLEAMASGLPTITTVANGAGESIEHGRSGFILDDPRDVDGLATLMTAMFDADFRRRAGAAARRAMERQTMDANSQRYLELYGVSAARRGAA